LLWKKWHWDRLLVEFLGIPLSVSFHHDSLYSHIIWGLNNRHVSGCSSDTYSRPIDTNNNNNNNTLQAFTMPDDFVDYFFEVDHIMVMGMKHNRR
jgi:hypothetical protein